MRVSQAFNDAMKPYWSSRVERSVVPNILLKASRIIIPSSMRLEILDKIHGGHGGHGGHQGITLFGGQDSAEKSRIWCNNAELR